MHAKICRRFVRQTFVRPRLSFGQLATSFISFFGICEPPFSLSLSSPHNPSWPTSRRCIFSFPVWILPATTPASRGWSERSGLLSSFFFLLNQMLLDITSRHGLKTAFLIFFTTHYEWQLYTIDMKSKEVGLVSRPEQLVALSLHLPFLHACIA